MLSSTMVKHKSGHDNSLQDDIETFLNSQVRYPISFSFHFTFTYPLNISSFTTDAPSSHCLHFRFAFDAILSNLFSSLYFHLHLHLLHFLIFIIISFTFASLSMLFSLTYFLHFIFTFIFIYYISLSSSSLASLSLRFRCYLL